LSRAFLCLVCAWILSNGAGFIFAKMGFAQNPSSYLFSRKFKKIVCSCFLPVANVASSSYRLEALKPAVSRRFSGFFDLDWNP